jgi:1-acyl-sn-glycerol-3-phosphate acyltransferase
MNVLKRVAGHIYLVYFLLLFLVTMLPAWLAIACIYILREPSRSKALHHIFRVWMGLFMPLAGCPVSRRGRQHFKPGQQYVVVCNHNSFIDVPVSTPWVPGPGKTLAKAEIARVPLFGLIYKAGSILVDRKNENSRKDSFRAMRHTLQMGLHLTLYPEGTRNQTGEDLQPFHDGAFVVAIREQVPVIPALIFNTGKILPHNRTFWAWPHRVRIHFLEPVPTARLSMKDMPELKERIWQIMSTYYRNNKTS